MEIITGVDEVGRGPLAGPVVAAAVVLSDDHPIEGLRDSKKLSKKRRNELYPIIIEHALGIGIGEASVSTIDKINIREATFLAMERALEKLPMVPDRALVDGEALRSQKIPNEGVVKGDDKIESIMAASIIAKVTRDRIMSHYGRIFPEYGFERNSGYGTKEHLDALDHYMATPIHRRTFSPVKDKMPTIGWLLENDRISWMCEKLAGLYLRDSGYDILEVDHGNEAEQKINIIANENGDQTVFVKVETIPIDHDDKIEFSIKDDEAIRLKKSVESYYSELDVKEDHRIDMIFIRLNKNNPPSIKHFKGII